MHTISREIAHWHKRFGSVFTDHMRRASLDPWEFGKFLREEGGYPEAIQQHVQVLGALASRWWQTGRTIWTVSRETCQEVARTGVNFLPELPPESWDGGCIIIEGKGGAPLFEDVVSLGAFVETNPKSLASSYWVIFFRADGHAAYFSLASKQPKINAASRRKHGLADAPMEQVPDLDGNMNVSPPDLPQLRTQLLDFLFAFSFYAASPDRSGWEVAPAGDGPIERGANGKPVRRNGRPAPLWLYRDARPKPATFSESEASEARGRLDTQGLTRAGVLVQQHFRQLRNGAVRLIRPYPSHRWKREDKLGAKVTV